MKEKIDLTEQFKSIDFKEIAPGRWSINKPEDLPYILNMIR